MNSAAAHFMLTCFLDLDLFSLSVRNLQRSFRCYHIYQFMTYRLRKIFNSSQLQILNDLSQSRLQHQENDDQDSPNASYLLSARPKQLITSRFKLLSLQRPEKKKEPIVQRHEVNDSLRRYVTETQRKQHCTSLQLSKSRAQSNKKQQLTKIRKRIKSQFKLEFKPHKYLQSYSFSNNTVKSKDQNIDIIIDRGIKLSTKRKDRSAEKEEILDNYAQDYEQEIRYFPAISSRKKTVNYDRKKYLINGSALKMLVEENLKRCMSLSPLKKLKKCAHSILFLIKLRKFFERKLNYRKLTFPSFLKSSLLDRLFQLKQNLTQSSRQFFDEITDHHNFDYRIYKNQDILLGRQKVKALRYLVKLQFECVRQCIVSLSEKDNLCQLFYQLCGHGSLSSLHSIYTIQELYSLCLSPKNGSIRADKDLQKAALLQLVLVKLTVYNMMMQPQKVEWKRYKNLRVLNSNLLYIGNMMYAILVEAQDDYLQRAAPNYAVGNWQEVTEAIEVRTAESMTVKQGYIQANELISGLKSRSYVLNLLGSQFVVETKKTIDRILLLLHQMVVRYRKTLNKAFLET